MNFLTFESIFMLRGREPRRSELNKNEVTLSLRWLCTVESAERSSTLGSGRLLEVVLTIHACCSAWISSVENDEMWEEKRENKKMRVLYVCVWCVCVCVYLLRSDTLCGIHSQHLSDEIFGFCADCLPHSTTQLILSFSNLLIDLQIVAVLKGQSTTQSTKFIVILRDCCSRKNCVYVIVCVCVFVHTTDRESLLQTKRRLVDRNLSDWWLQEQ